MPSATKNKWLKYRFLKKFKPIAPYVPETRPMSERDFWELMRKYKHVIIKPVWGSRGRGVIQISSLGDHRYELHFENIRTTIKGRKNTFRYIRRKIGSIRYMVQRRISRPTIKGRPFDMRVIVQRRKKSPVWTVTGKVIKVAGKGYIVSNNSRSNGTLLEFNSGIRKSSIKHLSHHKIESRINRIALLSTKRLNVFFPGHRMYGFDMGPDRKGHIWIIEANLFPSRSHFLKLKDKTMYHRITAFKKG
jgi:hypothetical protein